MPFTPLAGADVNALALQIVDTILFIDATGLTVTVTVKVAPVQTPDNGVTVYVAVCGVLVGLVSVPLILAAAAPAAPPVIAPVTAGAAQLYVVPAGTVPLVISTGVTVNPTVLHVVLVMFVIADVGLTVTGKVRAGKPCPHPFSG